MAVTIYLRYGSGPTVSHELTARSDHAIVAPDSLKLVQAIEDDLTVMDAGDLTLTCANLTHWWESAFQEFSPTSRYPDTWYVELYKGGVLRWQGDVDPASIRYDRNARTCTFTARGILKRLERYPASLVRRDFKIGAYTGYATAVGASYITDSAARWTADEWVGWLVLDAAATPNVYRITANTATQLTVDSGTPTSGRYRILPYVATCTAGTGLANRTVTFNAKQLAADVALLQPYDVIRHVPQAANPRLVTRGDEYRIVLPRFEWQYQDIRVHYVGARVNTDPPQVTLTDHQILILEDLDYTIAAGDMLLVQTPYYRDITVEEYVQRLFAAAEVASGSWAQFVMPTYLGQVIPYAEADDKTVAEALTEIAALLGATLYADADVYKIVGRDIVDPTKTIVDLSGLIATDTETHAWEQSVDYVVAKDATGSEVWRGVNQLSGKRLDVETDYILTYEWLRAIADRNYRLFGGRRKYREITVVDPGDGIGYSDGTFEGMTIGSFPTSGWAAINGVAGSWTVETLLGHDSDTLRVYAAGDSWRRVCRDDLGEFRSVDVRAMICPGVIGGGSTYSTGYLLAGIDPAGGYNQGIFAVLSVGVGLALYDWRAGVPFFLANDLTVTVTGGTRYWVRMKVTGLAVYVRVWEYGTDEPTTWNITTTAHTAAYGYVGVGYYYGGSYTWYDDVMILGEPSYEGGYNIGDAVSLPALASHVNLLSDNAASMEVDASAWAAYGSATLTQSTTQQLHGSYSLKVVTAGAGANEGARLATASMAAVTAGQGYTASAYVIGTAGVDVYITVGWYTAGSAYISSTTGSAVALTGAWQRLVLSGTAPATAAKAMIYVRVSGTVATTFYTDGVQVEAGSVETPFYVSTDPAVIDDEEYVIWGVDEPLRAFEERSEIGLKLISARVYDQPLVWADFDGTAGYIDVGDYCDLGDSFTVEAWVDSDDWTAANGAIISKVASLGITGWKIHFTGAGICRFYAPELTPTDFDINIGTAGPVHIAVVKDGATVTTYVNGEQDTQTAAVAGSFAGNALTLRLGCSPGPYDWYDGRLREVRVWDEARTQADLKRFMWRPLLGTESGLIGYWPLNEGYGGAIHDGSPTGADGLFYVSNWELPETDEHNTAAKPERPTIVSSSTDASTIEVVFDCNIPQTDVVGWFARIWPAANSRDEAGYTDVWLIAIPYRDASGRQIDGRYKAIEISYASYSGDNMDISTVAYDGRVSEPSDALILP